MPIMKNFYQPLKKAIQRIEKDNSGSPAPSSPPRPSCSHTELRGEVVRGRGRRRDGQCRSHVTRR
eukprot:3115545-Rhodomonas_salina.1